jgi:hypothetical protein
VSEPGEPRDYFGPGLLLIGLASLTLIILVLLA